MSELTEEPFSANRKSVNMSVSSRLEDTNDADSLPSSLCKVLSRFNAGTGILIRICTNRTLSPCQGLTTSTRLWARAARRVLHVRRPDVCGRAHPFCHQPAVVGCADRLRHHPPVQLVLSGSAPVPKEPEVRSHPHSLDWVAISPLSQSTGWRSVHFVLFVIQAWICLATSVLIIVYLASCSFNNHDCSESGTVSQAKPQGCRRHGELTHACRRLARSVSLASIHHLSTHSLSQLEPHRSDQAGSAHAVLKLPASGQLTQ